MQRRRVRLPQVVQFGGALVKFKRAVRLHLNRKYRSFRKHLAVRKWHISLAAQRYERRLIRSWSGLED